MDGDDDDKIITHGTQVTKFAKEFAMFGWVIKDHIFPVKKISKIDNDLKFSNKPTSICQIFAEKLSIPMDELEDWWDCQSRPVNNKFKGYRNNTIKGIKKLYQGK